MGEYIANPVKVDAFKIIAIREEDDLKGGMERVAVLENDDMIVLTEGMTARYSPVEGDYLVRQQHDGYEYLNPKEVFERKYRASDTATEEGDTHDSTSAGEYLVPIKLDHVHEGAFTFGVKVKDLREFLFQLNGRGVVGVRRSEEDDDLVVVPVTSIEKVTFVGHSAFKIEKLVSDYHRMREAEERSREIHEYHNTAGGTLGHCSSGLTYANPLAKAVA